MHVLASAADEQDWIREALAAPLARAEWRVWRYREPAIVLGLSQRRLHEAVAARVGASIPVLVRASGGGAVLVGPWMVGVTVLLPTEHRLAQGALVDSYRWLGRLHVDVLSAGGVPARVLSPAEVHGADAAQKVAWACFGGGSPWEVVDAAGRKLTGLAQCRRRNGLAFTAGTLVSRPPWQLLCDALGEPRDFARLDALTAACDEAPGVDVRDATGWALRLEAALEETLAG